MDTGTGNGQRRTSRRAVLAALGGSLAGCLGAAGDRNSSLTVFHAGSLSAPFDRLATEFERTTDISVDREAQGSVYSTRKITDEGRRADVLGVSDYRLLRDEVLPQFGSWYAVFATNAMTIHYTPDSSGASEVTTGNWWNVLSRDDVRIGHSDPAADPGGYRAVMAQQLGAIPFDGETLYGDATYEALRENSTVTTDTEVNLVAQLQAGKLDYAFNYRSVGTTHDVRMVDLQPAVDLSRASARYAAHYANAVVETESGVFTGAPIGYGITVPTVARSPDRGAHWIAVLLGSTGRDIARETGFEAIDPAVVPDAGASSVPDRVQDHTISRSHLGPLQL